MRTACFSLVPFFSVVTKTRQMNIDRLTANLVHKLTGLNVCLNIYITICIVIIIICQCRSIQQKVNEPSRKQNIPLPMKNAPVQMRKTCLTVSEGIVLKPLKLFMCTYLSLFAVDLSKSLQLKATSRYHKCCMIRRKSF